MILGALIAIETTDLLSSVISVSAVGLGLSIIFLTLAAPDLAIIQVVVDIIALVMLLRLVVKREDVTVAHRYQSEGTFATSAGLIFFGVFLVFAAYAFREMPVFGSPLMTVSQDYLQNGFDLTSIPNLVTAILLDFRAYDTLGEATVIFCSIIGALVVLRKKGRVYNEGNDLNR